MNEHLTTNSHLAAGLRSLPATAMPFSSTQAAWRFFRNPQVTLKGLLCPLIEACRHAVRVECCRYAVVVHDWSNINYCNHSSKIDRVRLGPDIGYQLLTSLMIHDRSGLPIAPVCLNLWTKAGIHTTLGDAIVADKSPLDMIGEVMQQIAAQDYDKPLVHIIDRGADSVRHYREWDKAKHKFIVRARDYPYVVWQGQKLRLREVVANLQLRSGGTVSIAPQVIAQELLAETVVRIDRAGRSNPRRRNKNEPSKKVKGEPIDLRLIYVQLRLPDESLIAEWLLLTNLAVEVTAEVIATWYYWRWAIETYFKLMKSAGHHLEQWQQETGEAISKRMLVAAMASVMVWCLMREEGKEAEKAKEMLVRLSGRQVRKCQATASAMLAGLWVLLSIMEVLEHYSLDELRKIAGRVAPSYSKYHNTGPPGG